MFREAKVKFGASFVLNGVVTDEGNVLKDNYSNFADIPALTYNIRTMRRLIKFNIYEHVTHLTAEVIERRSALV